MIQTRTAHALACAVSLILLSCVGDTKTTVYENPEQTAFTQTLLDCEGEGQGAAAACIEAAAKVEAGALGAPDPKGACTYYGRACDLGQTEGCTKQAACLEAGTLGEPQYVQARDLYLTACMRGDRTACEGALSILREGRPGVEADPEGARALLQAGCEKGDAEACAAVEGDGAEAASDPAEEAAP